MRSLEKTDVMLAEYEIHSAIFNLNKKILLTKKNAPNRTELIEEFEQDERFLVNGLSVLRQLKEDYMHLSIRFQEIAIDNANFKREVEKKDAKIKELENRIEEILKF